MNVSHHILDSITHHVFLPPSGGDSYTYVCATYNIKAVGCKFAIV